MPRKSQGLYAVLEKHLKEAKDTPLTCVDLWDKAEVRKYAESTNRVSDYLGHLWRKGKARRLPAPPSPNSDARFAYTWNYGSEVSLSSGKKIKRGDGKEIELIHSEPNLEITEDGETIQISLPKFTITIRRKT